MRRVNSLFAWPALTPITVESVSIQFFEQVIVRGPIFEWTLRPQQNKRTSVRGAQKSQMIPWTETSFDDDLETGRRGYLLVPPTEGFTWSDADLPPDLARAKRKNQERFS
jgi:hypothetical protein